MTTLIPPDFLSLCLCLIFLTLGTRRGWRIDAILVGCVGSVAFAQGLGLIRVWPDGALDYRAMADLHFALSLRFQLLVTLLLPVPFLWVGYRFTQMRHLKFLFVSLWLFVVGAIVPNAVFSLDWALWEWGYMDLGELTDEVLGSLVVDAMFWICSVGGWAGLACLVILPIVNLIFYTKPRPPPTQ